MKLIPIAAIAGACLAVAALAPRASAQAHSSLLITDLHVVPGQAIDIWEPNVFDPFHPKHLTFKGHAEYLGTHPDPPPLVLYFDWLNPATGQEEFSQPSTHFGPIDAEWWLPFCPEQVSIHFQTQAPGGFLVNGVFEHTCIPEPAEVGLIATLGLLSLALTRRFQGAGGH